MPTILHLIRAADYEAASDQPIVVACPLDEFIHCTGDAGLLLQVANLVYRQDTGDFLVLELDPTRLAAEVRWEAPEPPPPPGSPLEGQRFPHLYGPLNREAIVAVRPARRAPDGAFVET
jgi:uncharacterized protein (DUF952 family)